MPGKTVVGIGVTGVSSNGVTTWVHRTNSTQTQVHWMIIGLNHPWTTDLNPVTMTATCQTTTCPVKG